MEATPTTLTDEVAALEAQLQRLRARREDTSRMARGLVGSPRGHALAARASVLAAAVTDMEGPLQRLKALVGQPAAAPSPGQPVHGSFEVRVTHNVPVESGQPDSIQPMIVWPSKSIAQVVIESLQLLGLAHLAGTWGLWIPGTVDAVQELTVSDARIEPNQLLELRRA